MALIDQEDKPLFACFCRPNYNVTLYRRLSISVILISVINYFFKIVYENEIKVQSCNILQFMNFYS